MRYHSIMLLAIMIPSAISAAAERQGSGRGMQVVLSLEPGPGNPRNSEGDFIRLKNGRILYIYSHYSGRSGRDDDSAYLASRYSDNDGRSWSSESLTVIPQEGRMNIMSVSLLRLQNGEIALFYLRKNSTEDCIPLVRFSRDEAQSWSDPIQCITDRQGYFVLNNDRVIQLRDGRLMLGVALHQEPGKPRSNIGRIFAYYSDDNGRTWKSGEEVQNPDNVITQEPGLVELKNGEILMFLRTDAGVQYISRSSDRGVTWLPASRSNIPSPLSPASIGRIPSTGDLLMVWNNNGGDNLAMKGKRTPQTVAISRDEGESWDKIKNIEDDPDGWYCYTAIEFTGKSILLAYCAGNRPKGTGLAVTHIARISKRWIYR